MSLHDWRTSFALNWSESMADWRATTFGQLGELFDGPHATPTRTSQGPYFLNISSLIGGRLDLTLSDRVSPEDYRRWTRRVTPRAGDLLFSYETRLGEAALMPDGVEACLGRRMALLRPDRSVVDPRFLVYLYLAPQFQRTIATHTVHGATVPRIALSTMPTWSVDIPGLREQRAVAEILGTLDDKIIANERSVEALGKLERAKVETVIASASDFVRLDSVATVTKGVSYRRYDLDRSRSALITLKSIDRTGTFARRGFKEYIGAPRAEQFVHSGDIVVAQTDLTQGADVIGWAVRVPRVAEYERLVASLDLAIVRPLPTVRGEYLLGALRSRSFRDHCHARMSGTTVLHLGRGAIESYRFPLPDTEVMERYAVSSASRFRLQDSLNDEIQKMMKTRDELLPLLMSGRLRVKDAERAVEEVL
ncbi:MAG: restriction endonuclease subunit S [Micropruina sp.]